MVQAMPYPNITDSKQDCLEYVAVLQDRLLERQTLTQSDIICQPGKNAKIPLTVYLNPNVQRRLQGLGFQEPRTLFPQTYPMLLWQEVYDDLGIEVSVPQAPLLTAKQYQSLETYRFMQMYIPAITEDEYPKSFVKPEWGQYLRVEEIERRPLNGRWVAVEMIKKPDRDDPKGYPDDRLMAAVKHATRFNTSHDDLTGGLLAKIAKTTGFSSTRLPTAEKWNFTANIFNWLRDHRGLSHLPDLGSTRSWEWCQNAYGSEARLDVGGSGDGGLAGVHGDWRDGRRGGFSFRVLAVL